MVVNELTLKHFRNIQTITICPCSTVNIIYGDNAQGKTNLMEAIWMFSGSPSFRTLKAHDLILFGQKRAALALTFTTAKRQQHAKIQLGAKKEFVLNHVPLSSASELAGNFFCMLFTPLDLQLADGTPSKRRRFLDVAISQITPQYVDYLENYERVLDQRNSLLKDYFKFPSLKDTLEVWDIQLAKLGTILSIYRGDYVSKLKKFVGSIYHGLSSGKETLEVEYFSTVFDQMDQVTKYDQKLVNIYFERLQSHIAQDVKYGYTSMGVHRDDLALKLEHLSVKNFASRGQIRSSVLALKLSEAELLEKITGEKPVILLDDVMSELDHKRQDYILNHVKHKQVFITCCDVFNTMALKSGRIFKMESGRLVEQRHVRKS